MKYCCLDLFEKNDGIYLLMEEIGIVSLGHLPKKGISKYAKCYLRQVCFQVPCLPPPKPQKDGEKRERQEKQAKPHKIQR